MWILHRDSGTRPIRSPRRKRNRDGGQSLVEFALVFPVFMLVLAGILDFGFMLYSRMTVINAAREGARIAVTAKDPLTIPSLVDSTVISVSSAVAVANLSDSIVCVPLVSASCDFVAGGKPDPQPGDAVKVTVSYGYRTFFPLFFGTTVNMSSTVQMVLE